MSKELPIMDEDKRAEAIKRTIAGHAVKGEIAAWNRKRKSIERLVTEHIHPMEDEILEWNARMNAKLRPLYDQLNAQRAEMVEFCIHPADLLEVKESHVECKFCAAKLAVPNKVVDHE